MENRLRWDLRSVLSQYPIFLTIARWRYPRTIGQKMTFVGADIASDDTDIVIEGFPRSGNTFAVTAFQMAQSKPVKLANHLHAPAQVKAAVKRNIPTAVLIRDPEDAAISFIIQQSSLTGRQVFEQYIRFHRAIQPMMDKIIIAPFEQVTTDFGQVISRVNERFGTQFEIFHHTRENEQHCFEIIEQDSIKLHGGSIRERGVARPSESRREIKKRLRAQLRGPELEAIRSEAYDIYHQFVKNAALQPA